MIRERLMKLVGKRIEIHYDDFNVSSIYDKGKMDSMFESIDASIKKMLFPGASILLTVSTPKKKKDVMLTNYIEIRKYDNDPLKNYLHNKIKNAIVNRFKKKYRGYKITVCYNNIIIYPSQYQETNPLI